MPSVDEFIHGSLKSLEYLPVGPLNLLTGDLYITPEFLGCQCKCAEECRQHEY